MEDGMSNSKEKEVIVDIGSDKASPAAQVKRDPILGNKRGKRSLNRFASGVLNYNGSDDDDDKTRVKSDGISGGSLGNPYETLELLVEKNPSEQQSQGLGTLTEKDHDREKRKVGKVRTAAKPPRPPNGPSLNAADMRLIKEITKIAMKKRERVERIKASKKMYAAKFSSPSTSTSLLSSSCRSTILAMAITVLFLLVLIFQGFGASASSNSKLAAAQPAPETVGSSPVQFYKAVLSDDGAAPILVPPTLPA